MDLEGLGGDPAKVALVFLPPPYRKGNDCIKELYAELCTDMSQP